MSTSICGICCVPSPATLQGEPRLTQSLLAVSLSAFHAEKWVLCLEHPKGG